MARTSGKADEEPSCCRSCGRLRELVTGSPVDATEIKQHLFLMAGSEFRPPNPIVLGDVVREHLGQQLRGVYSDLLVSDLPADLIRLIGRLECESASNADPQADCH